MLSLRNLLRSSSGSWAQDVVYLDGEVHSAAILLGLELQLGLLVVVYPD